MCVNTALCNHTRLVGVATEDTPQQVVVTMCERHQAVRTVFTPVENAEPRLYLRNQLHQGHDGNAGQRTVKWRHLHQTGKSNR